MNHVTQAVPSASYKVMLAGQLSVEFQDVAEDLAYLTKHAENTHLWRLTVEPLEN
jgi:hypothetical protein